MAKVETRIVRVGKVDFPMWLDTKGRITMPLRLTPTRCRADIREKLKLILKDKQQIDEVLDLIDDEFSGIMTDYRINGILV